jgi:hypothetical protein
MSEPPKPRLEIDLDIFSKLDQTVFPIYPLKSPILSQCLWCPAKDQHLMCYTFQLVMMSLALFISGEKDESRRYLMDSTSMLDEACPHDDLLACISYLKLVPPSWILSLNKAIVAMLLGDPDSELQKYVT